MKKLLLLFLIMLCSVTISASAEEVTYQNVITDDTSIEFDFKTLGMNINDYYVPKSYDYDKWYVIAMSEAYVDNKIQTYFYLYNPTVYSELNIELSYQLDSGTIQTDQGAILEYSTPHCLTKVKSFSYSYVENVTISITNIKTWYSVESEINSGEDVSVIQNFESTFKAKNRHSLLDKTLGIELNYNSTLIIDEVDVVPIEVKKDDNFINNWNEFWTLEDTSMYVYFYNFNFPDYIEYDYVEYAKFKYDYVNYNEKIYLDSYDFSPSTEYAPYNTKDVVSRETVLNEYNNDSKTLRVNQHSQELNFPTFYLGNRINDKQFGTLEVSGELDSFDYDCSVLLDSTYRYSERIYSYPKPGHRIPCNDVYYTALDQIEFLELWYNHNGVTYKCKVVAPNMVEDDFHHGTAEPPKPTEPEKPEPTEPVKPFWQRLLIEIADFILKILQIDPNIVPNWGKYMISSAALLVGLILCVVVLWILSLILSLIPGIGGAFGKIFSAITAGIWFVITLPFRIVTSIISKIRGD